ncbi:hypothetical protein D3C86_1694610 [compost metagenome]
MDFRKAKVRASKIELLPTPLGAEIELTASGLNFRTSGAPSLLMPRKPSISSCSRNQPICAGAGGRVDVSSSAAGAVVGVLTAGGSATCEAAAFASDASSAAIRTFRTSSRVIAVSDSPPSKGVIASARPASSPPR